MQTFTFLANTEELFKSQFNLREWSDNKQYLIQLFSAQSSDVARGIASIALKRLNRATLIGQSARHVICDNCLESTCTLIIISEFNETRLSQGILPIDTYKKALDQLCDEPLHYDWEELRQEIVTYGLRNSTLSALMPSETSSQISNATNGIEPPRGYISVKASKDGILKQVVPEFDRLKDNYELLWDIPSNNGYLQVVGLMQKFVDQSISANTNYDPSRFPNNRVPMKTLLADLLTAYKYGVKTLYYHNTRDGASDQYNDNNKTVVVAEDDDCAGGACKI